MTECYFIPKKNTTSATICANCGLEKSLHTIGEGVKANKVIIMTDSEIEHQIKMDGHQVLNYKWSKGVKEVYPAHDMVKNWLFDEGTEEEANLANAMAIVAKKSGMTANDLQHIFPAVLRMLKNDSAWSK